MPLIAHIQSTSETGSTSPYTINLATMRAMVRERISESEEDFWSDVLINTYLNEACYRFLHEERWSWLQTHVGPVTITSGVSQLNVMDDIALNRQFSLMLTTTGTTNSYLPRKVSPQEGFALRAKFTSGGVPQWYYLVATPNVNTHSGEATLSRTPALRLVPTPNVAMQAEYMYFREPTQMAADSDVPDVPSSYTESIVSWATGLCWLKELNGGGKAQEQFNLYQAVLEQARKDQDGAANDDVLVMGRQEPSYDMTNKSPFGLEFPATLGP